MEAAVPRYYFHLDECGDGTQDQEGHDIADNAAARAYAINMARSIMRAEIDEGRLCMRCAIKIAEADGEHVMTVQFSEAIKLSGV